MHLSYLSTIPMQAILTMFTNHPNYTGNFIPKIRYLSNLDALWARPQLSNI